MDIKIQPEEKPLYKRIKTIYLVALIGLATLSLLAASLDPALPSIDGQKIWVGEVKKGEFNHEITGIGRLVPVDNRWVSNLAAGSVERVLVKPGATVTKNSILITLRNPELQQQAKQSEWEYEASFAESLALRAELEQVQLEQDMLLAQAHMEVESAVMNEKAQAVLAKKNIISSLEYETSKLKLKQSQLMLKIRKEQKIRRLEVSKSRLAAEDAKVSMFRNQLNRMQSLIDSLNIRAGIDGVVQQISIEPGQQINAGTSVARVADPATLYAELQVQEVFAKSLRVGQVVMIDTRNELLPGKITRVDPRINQGNVIIDVELDSHETENIRPDLSVTGNILVKKITDAIYIDRPVGTAANSNASVFVVDANSNIAKKNNIAFGSASVSQIEILSGLAPGDKIIVSDTQEYAQYEQIKIKL